MCSAPSCLSWFVHLFCVRWMCLHLASIISLVRAFYSAFCILSGPNTNFFFEVRFHTALFACEPEIVNKPTCAKVIHSLGHPFNCTRVHLESGPGPPLQLGLGTVDWSAPECDCCIHTCPKVPHQRGNELEFDSIEPNKTGVNTPLECKVY